MNQLNEFLTLDQLWNSTNQAFGDGRDQRSNEITVSNITYTKKVRLGGANASLAINADATNSGKGTKYRPTITFVDAQFEDQAGPDTVTIKDTGGHDLHLVPTALTKDNVRVRCTCLDFYFRFSHPDKSKDALYGRTPPKYIRKTTTHPPVNPTKAPGFCKHTIKLLMYLQQQRIIR